jgi:hypothetical protein
MNMDQTTPDSIPGDGVRSIDWNRSRLQLWHSFCQRYRVGEDSVPLFECDESGSVLSKEVGSARRRKILQRIPQRGAETDVLEPLIGYDQ